MKHIQPYFSCSTLEAHEVFHCIHHKLCQQAHVLLFCCLWFLPSRVNFSRSFGDSLLCIILSFCKIWKEYDENKLFFGHLKQKTKFILINDEPTNKPTNQQTEATLLEKIIVPQLVQEFPALYRNKRFITMFTKSTTCPYSQPDESNYIYLRSILMLFSNTSLGLPSSLFISGRS